MKKMYTIIFLQFFIVGLLQGQVIKPIEHYKMNRREVHTELKLPITAPSSVKKYDPSRINEHISFLTPREGMIKDQNNMVYLNRKIACYFPLDIKEENGCVYLLYHKYNKQGQILPYE